jgi:hypothetical protein
VCSNFKVDGLKLSSYTKTCQEDDGIYILISLHACHFEMVFVNKAPNTPNIENFTKYCISHVIRFKLVIHKFIIVKKESTTPFNQKSKRCTMHQFL